MKIAWQGFEYGDDGDWMVIADYRPAGDPAERNAEAIAKVSQIDPATLPATITVRRHYHGGGSWTASNARMEGVLHYAGQRARALLDRHCTTSLDDRSGVSSYNDVPTTALIDAILEDLKNTYLR